MGDLIALTEIWLRTDDTDNFIATLTPTDYNVPMCLVLQGEVVESVCLSGTTHVSSYCHNHVFIHLKAFLFSYQLAVFRRLFSMSCTDQVFRRPSF